MAFAVDALGNIRPIGTSISRFGRSFHFLSGAALVGAGFAASAWLVATVAAMHAIVPAPQPGSGPLSNLSLARKHAIVQPAERVVHIAKFSRLRPLAAAGDLALKKGGRLAQSPALIAAFVGQSAPLSIAEAAPTPKPVVVAAATPVAAARLAKDDTVASAPVVAHSVPVAASAASSDRIIVPSKDEVASAEGPALLALAAPPQANSKPQATLGGSPAAPGPVEVASAAMVSPIETDAQSPASTKPFDLVLTDRSDVSIPLPMARPDGLAKRGVAPTEPVLAYARPDAGDDGTDDTPSVRKRLSAPVARNGVAVYDISANIVYLPNGERLEAHSGLGKMRDNPRFVHARNRGPTPPHTYDLTMRESLFHGVEAIRLNPVGGAGNVYNRVGLLAHTYMLGARGDSNGCVSVKDYKRFLAAFKRGQIRQLVVVTNMPDKPASRLASLFSSRS
ncbi:DUF2778 domain-containing protein [Rhizobium sp. Root1220]|uniref:DUF2778 domain-containing protein n=1 Tax=Rhizobium sp. Root1220 TaxID=1736432 RepID=UPI0006FA6A95|nr:DUF2778 domain-containing protein [Rhizobium sp. Root1220]KQV81330.1 hypothetical protein ASC90_03125 [Rhizobium sp. Root1220]